MKRMKQTFNASVVVGAVILFMATMGRIFELPMLIDISIKLEQFMEWMTANYPAVIAMVSPFAMAVVYQVLAAINNKMKLPFNKELNDLLIQDFAQRTKAKAQLAYSKGETAVGKELEQLHMDLTGQIE